MYPEGYFNPDYVKTGVYIKSEIHIFAPPTFLIYIFSPTDIYYNEGVYVSGEKFSASFFQFCIF